jgi:hypothetical protein
VDETDGRMDVAGEGEGRVPGLMIRLPVGSWSCWVTPDGTLPPMVVVIHIDASHLSVAKARPRGDGIPSFD